MLADTPKELTEPALPVQAAVRILLEYECVPTQSQLLSVSDRKWRRQLRRGVWLLVFALGVLAIAQLLFEISVVLSPRALFPNIGPEGFWWIFGVYVCATFGIWPLVAVACWFLTARAKQQATRSAENIIEAFIIDCGVVGNA